VAVLQLTGSEGELLDAVPTPVFLAGRALVLAASVHNVGVSSDGTTVGRVTPRNGPAAIVFDVRLPRPPHVRLHGSCTCDRPQPCMHVVAVALSAVKGRPAAARVETTALPDDGPPAAGPAVMPDWAAALESLVGVTDPAARQPAAAGRGPTIGVQVQVTAAAQDVPAGVEGAVRLSLRPVVHNQAGQWVRTGVTWGTVGYLRHQESAPQRARRRVLSEMLALTTGDWRYAYGNDGIDVGAVPSRRLWDALLEARDLGVPFLQPGRAARPVLLHDPVRTSVVLRPDGDGLRVDPQLTTGDGTPVPAHGRLVVGEPVRALGWWAAGDLHLAPVEDRQRPALLALLALPAAHVPGPDVDRFLTDYYPALSTVTTIRAVGGVRLPEPAAPALVATLVPRPDGRLSVGWGWRYRLGATVRSEPLRADSLDGSGARRDQVAEEALLDAVRPLLSAVPELGAGADWLLPATELGPVPAMRMLTEVVPALGDLADVTVDLRGEALDYRPAAAAPVVTFTDAPAGDRDWFDLQVLVTVDGEEVPFAQLFVALAAGDSHLVLPSGVYFPLDDERFGALARLIEESRALNDAEDGATLRLHRYQADAWAELERLGVLEGQARQWQQTVQGLVATLDGAAAGGEAVPGPALPAGLHATLRGYQVAGFGWLARLHAAGLGGVLADDMGLGKTLQTLALFCHVREQGLSDEPFLVVAPTSVVANWRSEAATFAPGLRVATVSEMTARRGGSSIADLAAQADVVVASYTLFRLERPQYDGIRWAGLVLDEAQMVKNHQSRGYQCARTLDVPFRLAISGTPLENNLMELWALLSIAAPGLLSSPKAFTEFFRTPVERGRDADRLALLRRRIAPLMLRRTKEQVAADLPDKQEQVLEVDLAGKHRVVYDRYLHRERRKVLRLVEDFQRNRFEILKSLTLLRQASLDVGLVDPAHAAAEVPATKLDVLLELIAPIAAEGHRVLVFSQFTRFLGKARERLEEAGIETCYLDGKTRRRAEVIDRFRTGGAPVFLISLKAGGTGLTLTEADYCILLDPWWNPATENQAVDRAHRIGQTRKVMVYRLVAKDTIEEKVMALKAAKAELFASVLDGGEFASAALTAQDVRDLLT
jgi:hypothetical protein